MLGSAVIAKLWRCFSNFPVIMLLGHLLDGVGQKEIVVKGAAAFATWIVLAPQITTTFQKGNSIPLKERRLVATDKLGADLTDRPHLLLIQHDRENWPVRY